LKTRRKQVGGEGTGEYVRAPHDLNGSTSSSKELFWYTVVPTRDNKTKVSVSFGSENFVKKDSGKALTKKAAPKSGRNGVGKRIFKAAAWGNR